MLPWQQELTINPQSVSINTDSGAIFTGFMPGESTHSGEAFNPCLLTAPSFHVSPLYMDMFCFHSFSSWLPYQQLSRAQILL